MDHRAVALALHSFGEHLVVSSYQEFNRVGYISDLQQRRVYDCSVYAAEGVYKVYRPHRHSVEHQWIDRAGSKTYSDGAVAAHLRLPAYLESRFHFSASQTISAPGVSRGSQESGSACSTRTA